MAEDPIRSVLLELQRRFRVAGRGSVARVEQQLRLGAGYFKDQRRPDRQRIDLKILFQALDALAVPPAEFFAVVLGPTDAATTFRYEAAALRKRRRRLPAVLNAVRARNRAAAKGAGTPEADPDVDPAALDRLRIENPKLAMRRIRALIPRVDDTRLVALLGVYASACRATGGLDEAQMVLGLALELAERYRDPAARGDLLQRAGYVVANRGDYEGAHALAENATLVFVQLGDSIGIGRSLIDQGIWSGLLGHSRRSLRSLQAALKFLPQPGDAGAGALDPSVRRSRASCLISTGVVYRRLGDLDAAWEYAERAHAESDALDRNQYGKLLALQAAMARDLGHEESAEHLFREALALQHRISPLDTALCGIDLARLQLQRRRVADAYTTAKALVPLVVPLEKSPVAAALTELLRCALAGRGLTMTLLEHVRRGLYRERARPPDHTRRIRVQPHVPHPGPTVSPSL